MKSVAILGTRGVPNLYGGFEQCAEYLAKGLVDRGYDVTVYNPHWHPYEDSKYKGTRIIKKWCPEERLGASAHFIYDFICLRDALKRNTDVIIELGYGSVAISYYLCGINKSHIVTNMDGLEWKRDKWSAMTRKLMLWFEKIAALKSHELVSDNPGIRDYLFSRYGKESVYIPYGAKIFKKPDSGILARYEVNPKRYYIAIARMEPENNIEMILDGYIKSKSDDLFLVIGGTQTDYGRALRERYKNHRIKFLGGIYDSSVLNSLRHFAKIYFHGHSVGGTNPSLLEAMGAGAYICAHDNPFNRSVTEDGALYFNSSEDICGLITEVGPDNDRYLEMVQINNQKIEEFYNWDYVVDQYVQLINQ